MEHGTLIREIEMTLVPRRMSSLEYCRVASATSPVLPKQTSRCKPSFVPPRVLSSTVAQVFERIHFSGLRSNLTQPLKLPRTTLTRSTSLVRFSDNLQLTRFSFNPNEVSAPNPVIATSMHDTVGGTMRLAISRYLVQSRIASATFLPPEQRLDRLE